MDNEPLPKAIWSGSFKLFGVEVKCHTLDDGRRIIESDSVEALLRAMGSAEAPDTADEDQAKAFAAWQAGR